ncbi:hypothetical protein U9M48_039368 [Paspalum notatum var. saurae]|uniref:Uncharacterized protein n=1 Tax=Paspalum notatum var. saurae TaxID=547442 RepID=A0AAQ3XCM4_PASNO
MESPPPPPRPASSSLVGHHHLQGRPPFREHKTPRLPCLLRTASAAREGVGGAPAGAHPHDGAPSRFLFRCRLLPSVAALSLSLSFNGVFFVLNPLSDYMWRGCELIGEDQFSY